MENPTKDTIEEDAFGEAAETLPVGKSSPRILSQHNYVLDDLSDVKLDLESAALDLEAAKLMQRAAEAKRRAANVLRIGKGTVSIEDSNNNVKLDSDLCTKLPVTLDQGIPLHDHLSTPQKTIKTEFADDASKIGQLIARLELPRCEIPYFDGSPLQYVLFFRQFEEQIERRLTDDTQKLSYLYHYCQGRAKEAIKGCLLYSAEEGYRRARDILKELFGQRHLIVRAMLDDVTSPGPVSTDAEGLSSYANKLVNCADALEKLGFEADLNCISTIEKVLGKLPRFMSVDWVKRADEIYQCDREPSFRDLCAFVSSKARLQRNRYSYLLRDRKAETPVSVGQNASNRRTYVVSVSNGICKLCSANHALEECENFLGLSVKQRWSLVSRLRLCFVCLKLGHQASNCSDKNGCRESDCKQPHHRLLHQPVGMQRVVNASCQEQSVNLGISLGIVPVVIEGPKGCVLANALLDTGADTTLIREDIVCKVGLNGEPEKIHLNTPVGNVVRSCTRVSFKLKSVDGLELIEVNRAYTVPSILEVSAKSPSKQVLSKYSHLDGVDFIPLPSTVVDVLLGLDIPEVHWVLQQRRGKKGEPYADLTPLGWVLRGPMDKSHQKSARAFAVHQTFQEIETNLRNFYDQDFKDNGSFETVHSMEEERAIDCVEKSLSVENGHICVGLPWRDNGLQGKCNRSVADRRLACLKKRFKMHTDLKQKYCKVIDHYLHKGFAVKTDQAVEGNDDFEWFLPHHAVFNPKKPEKVRVVFDCAATFNGDSLNSHLLQGPNIVSTLIGVIMRFRKGRVALSADIEDMFLQVKVPKKDQSALRFLWWPEGDTLRTPEQYQLTVHPFGAVSSPFCASFALKKTATLFGHDYPLEVSQTVMDCFYVDDCLTSVNNASEAVSLIEGLSKLLSQGGFRLTKWLSNRREVLSSIPECDRSSIVKSLTINSLPTQRTLGLGWDMEDDSFVYEFQQGEPITTRRMLLSRLASIYDPMGWIGPYVLPLKLLFQDLCRKGVGWDEKFDRSVESKLEQGNQILCKIKDVRIPRWYARSTELIEYEVEMHIFCDASTVGYGAAAYFRFVHDNDMSHSVLVMAKSRVAPLKAVTVPRMELSAALVAVELSKLILKEIKLYLREVVFWTDSAVVLYYLRDNKSRFSTFVANRVSKIKDCTQLNQWRHVASDDNPADIASRGLKSNTRDIRLWFEGPDFLRKPGKIEQHPVEALETPRDHLELKSIASVNVRNTDPFLHQLERYSSWYKLLKSVAWILRFKQYLRILSKGQSNMTLRVGPLSVLEVRYSCDEVIKMVQLECFSQELTMLRNRANTPSHQLPNNLRKLNPIILNGYLCTGGRLQFSNLPDAAKHPIILPSKHFVTDLIIRYYHEFEGHVGCTQVLTIIRRRYWIIHGRASVRRVLGKCLKCRKESVRPCTQQMAPLPKERSISEGHAFAYVGVDFFGPLYVKHGRTEEKRYGCLFTCLSVRAVHIEVAHGLSTDTFLQALTRFIARRGRPKVIFSDNGSNFRGAYRELCDMLRNLSQSRIIDFLLEREIEWRFGPPEASHWGGVWERMIRSVRRILRAISDGQCMTDETLLTFMSEVERIINGRPLIPVTEDCRDLDVLTPNKLLLLRDNDTVMDYQNFSRSCLRFWRRVQVLADTFWKRWRVEYLSTLQERQKWLDKTENITPGSLVLVVNEGTHRSQWPLGLVEEVSLGTDGLVREVVVRTSRGNLRRDVRKICLLEGTFT